MCVCVCVWCVNHCDGVVVLLAVQIGKWMRVTGVGTEVIGQEFDRKWGDRACKGPAWGAVVWHLSVQTESCAV